MSRPPTARKIIRRVAFFDRRTRAVGGPSVRVRSPAYQNETGKPAAFMQNGRRLRLFFSIESSPGISRERFADVMQVIDKRIARYAPKALFVSLIVAVYVGGQSVYTEGERRIIQASNGDAWLPTNGWELRRMYRNPIRLFKRRRFDNATVVQDQLVQSLIRAGEDHTDNKWIYVVGAEVDLVWFSNR